MKLEYEVEVYPEGKSPFKTKFPSWKDKRFKDGFDQDELDEDIRMTWVTYDPNNLSDIILDRDFEEALRVEFSKLVDANDEIRKSGEEAEAVIIQMDDLNINFPVKKAKAFRIRLDVTQKSGSKFQSKTHALITFAALEKYSIGRKVYVRYDPNNIERVALDSEKNKSIN